MSRILLLAAILGSGFATAEEIEIYVDKGQPTGTLLRVIEPEYPKAMLSAGKGGHVDVTGTVSALGELEDVKYTPDSPSSQAFIEPLREVVPYWRFRANVDDNCRPVAQAATTRMFFEVVDGKAKVSVTHATSPKSKPDLRAIKRVQPEYPKRALARGHESVVYASADVTPDGNVASVQAWAFPEHLSGNLFRDVTRAALMQYQFPVASPERKRRICYDLAFKLVN